MLHKELEGLSKDLKRANNKIQLDISDLSGKA